MTPMQVKMVPLRCHHGSTVVSQARSMAHPWLDCEPDLGGCTVGSAPAAVGEERHAVFASRGGYLSTPTVESDDLLGWHACTGKKPGKITETHCVLCESSRYATNPLWLLAADLHRSFAQAQKACTHESVLHNAH